MEAGLTATRDDELVAVGDAAVDAARAVLGSPAGAIDEGIVVLAAAHPGGGEAVAELDAAHGGHREEGVGDQGLGRVEEGLAEARREAADPDLDEAADRVAGGLGRRGRRRHVGAAARLDDARVEGDASASRGLPRCRSRGGRDARRDQDALGDRARGDEARGDAAREVARAAGIGEAAELVARGEVRVAGPGTRLKSS